MEKECPKCGSIVEATDPKGDGMCFQYLCEECGWEVMEMGGTLYDKDGNVL